MTARAVHWHEGMFLRPHHLQTEQRFWFHHSGRGEKWDHNYNWGIRSIDIDPDSLANYRLVVRSLKARLRDGTLVSIPEDGVLTAVDLQPAFVRESSITAYLAVPVLNLGRINVSGNGTGDASRYLLDTQELEDENTGVNPQPIQVRRLNCKLLLSTQDHAGYELLELGRIEKSATAAALPQLDAKYIPPLLACDGWKVLQADILEKLYDRISKLAEQQADLVEQQGISFDSPSPGDRRIFEGLRTLNEAHAWLMILPFARGVHPFPAYLQLCRLVGQLAAFGLSREDSVPGAVKKPNPRVPKLPPYDHDRLGPCFYTVVDYINGLLDDIRGDTDKVEARDFIGAGRRMQVALEPRWLQPEWQMFIGVTSNLPDESCERIFTQAGAVDMKIGSSERIEEVFQRGLPGLRFTHSKAPPRALPRREKLVYFQVDRTSQRDEWLSVQNTLSLAIKVNERRLEGNIDGLKEMTLRFSAGMVSLRFTLYIVPQSLK